MEMNFNNRNFGFGLMRLPMQGEDVDYDQVCQMIDYSLVHGFNYFDTAHGYLDGKSEIAARECLVKRHPRESFLLTNKLSSGFFEKEEDILPYFEEQCAACGVEYFDYYLMHALNAKEYPKYQKCKAFEIAGRLKQEGRIRHMGISFHDKPEVLEQILTDHPEIEVVQIQFNYLDYEDAGIQSRNVYDVCRRFDKPVIIMEPVKGGALVNLPEEAKQVFDDLHGGSYASYAIRFAASFEGVAMVLSGMSNFEQMEDNIGFMEQFTPLSEAEMNAVAKVTAIMKNQDMIGCTACRYCEAGCPMHICIPDLFACLNARRQFQDWNSDYYYTVHTGSGHGKAKDCITCRKCENICPQHLPVSDLIKEVSAEFDTREEYKE